MNVFRAPARPIPHLNESPRPWVFLAGSIEMGAAADWQSKVESTLKVFTGTLFNPRRDEWDASWDHGHPELIRQINWELDFLERADVILMYLDPTTRAPISLLELGLNSNPGEQQSPDLLVCCPQGFYRQTNVEVVCGRYMIPLFKDLPASLDHLVKKYLT